MKSIKVLIFSSLIALLALAGCGAVKSIEYYAANQAEAYKVIMVCQQQGIEMLKDKNCTNAIEGNAIAERAKNKIIAEGTAAALQKWQDDAAAQMKKESAKK
jgi:hypothetical protein